MKKYSVFSKEYEMLFEKNLSTFCENIRKTNNPIFTNKEYSLFFPSCGTDQKSEIEFIIYGQATNRWPIKFSINENIDFKSLTSKAKQESNSTDEIKDDNPLDWINNEWDKETRKYDYNPEFSFFWNVTYKLLNRYYDDDINSRNWCKKMIWSNLMKIAPSEGGNPYGVLWKAQMDKTEFSIESSVKLFKTELEEIQPKFAILLTGEEFAWEFMLGLGFKENIFSKKEFIIADEFFDKNKKTRIIVTKRPRLKGKDDEICVNQILKLIKK